MRWMPSGFPALLSSKTSFGSLIRSGLHGRQYRAVLTAADLATYAERYGAATAFVDFRARLRCRYAAAAMSAR